MRERLEVKCSHGVEGNQGLDVYASLELNNWRSRDTMSELQGHVSLVSRVNLSNFNKQCMDSIVGRQAFFCWRRKVFFLVILLSFQALDRLVVEFSFIRKMSFDLN